MTAPPYITSRGVVGWFCEVPSVQFPEMVLQMNLRIIPLNQIGWEILREIDLVLPIETTVLGSRKVRILCKPSKVIKKKSSLANFSHGRRIATLFTRIVSMDTNSILQRIGSCASRLVTFMSERSISCCDDPRELACKSCVYAVFHYLITRTTLLPTMRSSLAYLFNPHKYWKNQWYHSSIPLVHVCQNHSWKPLNFSPSTIERRLLVS